MYFSILLHVKGDPTLSQFSIIIIGIVLLAIIVGSVIGVLMSKRNKKTKFDDKISQPSVTSVLSSTIAGPTGKAGGLNANNVEGAVSVAGARIKHCQAVAGVFAHIFQKLGCFNKQMVNASRKTIASNFVTASGTSDAMAFIQKLLWHAPVDTNAYLQMAAEICNDKQRSTLANSVCSVLGRKFNAEEWKIVADVLDAIRVPADEKAQLQQRYSTIVNA